MSNMSNIKSHLGWIVAALLSIVLLIIINPAKQTYVVEPPTPDVSVPQVVQDTPNGLAPAAKPVEQPKIVTEGLGAAAYVNTWGRKNRWSPAQAVAWEWQQIKTKRPYESVAGLCAHQVSVAYGWLGYGYVSAKVGGQKVPMSHRYSIPSSGAQIPAGALVYSIGSSGGQYGHVVVSLGGGKFGSNDVLRHGRIDAVSLNWFRNNWGMFYAGESKNVGFWTEPTFPGGFGSNPNPAPKVSQPKKLVMVALPGKRSSAVPSLRMTLMKKSKSRSTFMGNPLTAKVKKWQASHNRKANGKVTKRQYKLILSGK